MLLTQSQIKTLAETIICFENVNSGPRLIAFILGTAIDPFRVVIVPYFHKRRNATEERDREIVVTMKIATIFFLISGTCYVVYRFFFEIITSFW